MTSENEEVREYERRLANLKSRDYTEEELEEWRAWAETWVDVH